MNIKPKSNTLAFYYFIAATSCITKWFICHAMYAIHFISLYSAYCAVFYAFSVCMCVCVCVYRSVRCEGRLLVVICGVACLTLIYVYVYAASLLAELKHIYVIYILEYFLYPEQCFLNL